MNVLVPFEFENKTIRVMDIDGEPWFVAADLCAVLEIGNVSMALRKLDQEDVTLNQIEGSHRPTNLISESGFYTLVLRSDKPQAKPFQKWATKEVFPTIRKQGAYIAAKLPPQFQAIQDLVLAAAENDRRIKEAEKRLDRLEGGTGYNTVKGYARIHGFQVPLSLAIKIGRKAKAICDAQGHPVGEATDERFGRVNSYPIEVLDEAIEACEVTI